MAGKKVKNWTEIEARYKLGESPVDIAKDYRDCNSTMIRSRASRGDWMQQRDEMRHTVAEAVAKDYSDDLEKLCKKSISVYLEFMNKLSDNMDMITNPYLFDGEKTNPLFQTAMKEAGSIFRMVYGYVQEKKPVDAEPITVQFEPFMKKVEGQDESIPEQEA